MIDEIGRVFSSVAESASAGSAADVIAPGTTLPGPFKDLAGCTVERFVGPELFGGPNSDVLAGIFDLAKKIFSEGAIDVPGFLARSAEIFGGLGLNDGNFPIAEFVKMMGQGSPEAFISAGKVLVENPEFTKGAFDAIVGLLSAAA